jgi:hypothetical protein
VSASGSFKSKFSLKRRTRSGFLGEFNLSGSDHAFSNSSTTLLTNQTDWQGNQAGWGSPYDASLASLGSNGVSPWGSRSGISADAEWIWAGDADSNDHAYFSAKISATNPVPEPSTIAMFGASFLILGIVGVRSRNKKS